MEDKKLEKYNKVVDRLHKRGGRLTVQRKQLLRVILNNPGLNCKELYYAVLETGNPIGISTVYRIVKDMESVGFLENKNKGIKFIG